MKKESQFSKIIKRHAFQDFFGALPFPIQMLLSDGTIVG